MGYEVTNVSKGSINDNLDTQDSKGNFETFTLGPREKVILTDDQFASRRVQRHVLHKRLRVKKVELPAPTAG